MTSVSLIAPYAPQPASSHAVDAGTAATQNVAPLKSSDTTSDPGLASDQSGQGAGNGTGTGGAQLTELMKRSREGMPVQRATSESIFEARSNSDPAKKFLERQAQRQANAKVAQAERLAERADAQAAEAKAEAEEAAKPEYVMPNPLPTAPILERDDA